jgi:hypothetical protein
MKSTTTQIVLHVLCIARGGNLRWHIAGIVRAIYEHNQS